MHPLQMNFPQHEYYWAVSSSANPSFANTKSQIGTDNLVAGGSEAQHIIIFGIGKKQMGQSSFAGGSLKSASSRSSAARSLQSFLCVAQ
jgi:hypothetical protein